ncbi:cytochrome P450 4C1-like [Culicoides brevitarsis]|uniref:cytochrome P450 4C1-like n=1 Tax=Culicoides brevitarsis TaxID=469753 RepID=UPI00307BD1BB
MIHLIRFLAFNWKLITFFTVLFTILRWYFKRRHLYYASWQLDGPLALPFIGNLFVFLNGRDRVFESTKQMLETYKAPQRFWIGPFLVVYLTEPDDLKIILNHPNALPKPFIYSITDAWLGEGLLTAPVEKWRVHRAFLQPTYNVKTLNSYMTTTNRCADILVKKLEKYVGMESVDVFNDVFMCALDMICRTTLETETNCQTGDPYGPAYLKASNSMFDIFQYRDVRPWLYPDFMFKMCKCYDEFLANVNVFRSFSQKVLHERRTFLKEMLDKNPSYKPENVSPVDALILSSLTQMDGPFNFTDDEIIDEIEIIIAGGADSSGHTICFVLLILAMHPDIQSRCYEEIKSLDAASELTKSDLNFLVYLDQVICETMRILPAVPIIGRELNGPVTLSNGVTLPAGTQIGIGIRDTHRNKAVWGDDADKFDPENFSAEAMKNRHPYSFIPFSGGPRNCIGFKFARNSMKVVLCKILRRFVLTTDRKLESLRCSMHPLLKLEGGWHVRLAERNS